MCKATINIYDGKRYKVLDSIRCEEDGEPWKLGRKLFERYDTIGKLDGLMRLGDIKTLGSTTKETESTIGNTEMEKYLHFKTHLDRYAGIHNYFFDLETHTWYVVRSGQKGYIRRIKLKEVM